MRMDRLRFNPLWLLGVVLVIVATVMFFAAAEGPTSIASRFLTALGTADSKTLAELSYMGDQPEAETKKQWDKTLELSRHFLFAWRILGDSTPTPDTAVVRVSFVKNAREKDAYEEPIELPLVKDKGKWKVDVRSISRELYPALPR
jgi:hypothetical protein